MPNQPSIRASVIGASGYTGAELIRLLHLHPNIEIIQLIAQKNANQEVGEIYPHLSIFELPRLIDIKSANWDDSDVVFCCLPHATSQAIIKELPPHLKIIDLSADFRLYDTDTYEKWYNTPHQAKELQKEAVYGLTELFKEAVAGARLVACPGCYPTSVTLPLIPLFRQHLVTFDDIIIDSKSGLTGAGRSQKQSLLFTEMNDNFKAYSIGKHRHIPEIEQMLSAAAGANVNVEFTPHLVPMNRGILSTIYAKLSDNICYSDIRAALENRYRNEPFVHVLNEGSLPSTKDVMGTNQCLIGVEKGKSANTVIIVSVIDNLVKGASGQAIQNMNIMFDLDETCGLTQVPLFP